MPSDPVCEGSIFLTLGNFLEITGDRVLPSLGLLGSGCALEEEGLFLTPQLLSRNSFE